MRVSGPLVRALASERIPLTQLRLGSKLPSLRNPLPQGEREFTAP